MLSRFETLAPCFGESMFKPSVLGAVSAPVAPSSTAPPRTRPTRRALRKCGGAVFFSPLPKQFSVCRSPLRFSRFPQSTNSAVPTSARSRPAEFGFDTPFYVFAQRRSKTFRSFKKFNHSVSQFVGNERRRRGVPRPRVSAGPNGAWPITARAPDIGIYNGRTPLPSRAPD
ncbi:hypothetical protein EVAR_66107_1 [Eumeta japonica]|uniref:Uncharacterized protein n=1 Tax=Eumeta variegata TaxID=151549 RepID=A0A4C2AAQ7_EUMVA|nr:hypothetical protein EVAR_66107_1 [Eumeta japonica]